MAEASTGIRGMAATRFRLVARIVMSIVRTTATAKTQALCRKRALSICLFRMRETAPIKFHQAAMFGRALLPIFYWRTRMNGEAKPGV